MYGAGAGEMTYIERYPLVIKAGILDTSPSSQPYAPTHSLELEEDTELRWSAYVFSALDNGKVVFVGRDTTIGVGTPECSVLMVLDGRDLSIDLINIYSRVTYPKVRPVIMGCGDGASVYFGDDPSSSGQATIVRVDFDVRTRLASRPVSNSLTKRSLVYEH